MAIEADLRPYVEAGYDLIPLHRPDFVDDRDRPRGKSPLDAGWRVREYDLAHVMRLAAEGHNVGVRIKPSDAVLDYDPRNDPDGHSLDMFQLFTGFDLEVCPTVQTGGGGLHFLVHVPEGTKLRNELPMWPGLEFKGHGKQVVAAGSTHPETGNPYFWAMGGTPLKDAPLLPEAVLAEIRRPEPAAGPQAEGTLSADQMAGMLAQLDVENFSEHGAWLELMMACHHAVGGDLDGREAFVQWSVSDPVYADHAGVIRGRWESLRGDATAGAVTVGTLYHLVREAGGQMPSLVDDYPELPDDAEEVVPEGALDGPPPGLGDDDPRERFNKTYAVACEGGKVSILRRIWRSVGDVQGHTWDRLSVHDFCTLHRNFHWQPPGADRARPIADLWLDWRIRRTFRDVVFEPGLEVEKGVLNLWEGRPVAPEPGDWSLTRAYLLEIVAAGDEECMAYLLRWMAWLFQRPAELPGVAVVLRGKKGAGKSFLGKKVLAPLVGGLHAVPLARQSHLTGRFNAHLALAVLVMAEEAHWAGDKTAEGALKELITEPLVSYEGKGLPIRQGRNCAHVLMTSNEDWVFPASLDDERRAFVLDVSGKRIGDRSYFDAISEELEAGGWAAMLADLLEAPLGAHPSVGVPETEALTSQKLISMDAVGSWWLERLRDGWLDGADGDWEDGPVTVPRQCLQVSLRGSFNRLDPRAASTRLGMDLRRLVPGLVTSRPLEADGRRGRCYLFPSLADCRAAFEAQAGSVPWDD